MQQVTVPGYIVIRNAANKLSFTITRNINKYKVDEYYPFDMCHDGTVVNRLTEKDFDDYKDYVSTIKDKVLNLNPNAEFDDIGEINNDTLLDSDVLSKIMLLIVAKYGDNDKHENAKLLLEELVAFKNRFTPYAKLNLAKCNPFYTPYNNRDKTSLANLAIALNSNKLKIQDSKYNKIDCSTKVNDLLVGLCNFDENSIKQCSEIVQRSETIQRSEEKKRVSRYLGDGVPALYLAVRCSSRDSENPIIKKLVDLGADPYSQNSEGLTALDSAITAKIHHSNLTIMQKNKAQQANHIVQTTEYVNTPTDKSDRDTTSNPYIGTSSVRNYKMSFITDAMYQYNITVDEDAKSFKGLRYFTNGSESFIGKELYLAEQNTSHFSTGLLRTLSNGCYFVPEERIMNTEEDNTYCLSEYKPDLIDLLNTQGTRPLFEENLPAMKNYARLMGVLHVLGEFDENMRNYKLDTQSGSIVKLDHTCLLTFSDNKPDTIYASYGCFQANCFFHSVLLGEEKYSSMDHFRKELSKQTVSNDNQEESTNDEEAYHKAKVMLQTDGISDDNFGNIISSITNNSTKKGLFEAFMGGLTDAIELMNDNEYMANYTKQYDETDLSKYAKICSIRAIRNASKTSQSLRKTIQYYNRHINKPISAANTLNQSTIFSKKACELIGRNYLIVRDNATGKLWPVQTRNPSKYEINTTGNFFHGYHPDTGEKVYKSGTVTQVVIHQKDGNQAQEKRELIGPGFLLIANNETAWVVSTTNLAKYSLEQEANFRIPGEKISRNGRVKHKFKHETQENTQRNNPNANTMPLHS